MGFVRKGWPSLVLVVVTLCIMFEPCLCDVYNPYGLQNAPNCAMFECPRHRVRDSEIDYEIRNYTEATWMHTKDPIYANSYFVGASKGFFVLFAYINGFNKKLTKINMTAPVLVNIYPSSPSSSYEVFFYMPEKFQKDTPKSDFVLPTTLPPPKKRFAAIRRFSGFMNDKNIAAELAALKKSLKGTYWEAATTVQNYTVASYNSPTEFKNRVNEVILWFDRPDE